VAAAASAMQVPPEQHVQFQLLQKASEQAMLKFQQLLEEQEAAAEVVEEMMSLAMNAHPEQQVQVLHLHLRVLQHLHLLESF